MRRFLEKVEFVFTVVVAVLMINVSAYGQEWQWPMSGKTKGTNVLYTPQSFIDRELNFGALFIGGDESDVVTSPFTGKVKRICLTYLDALNYSLGGDIDFGQSFEQSRRDFVKNSRRKAQYVSHSISLVSSDGKVLNITGLELKRKFKSGEIINVGDTLGTLAYSYYKIPEPSVMLDVSQYGKPVDPMSIFGLKTTFKEPEPVTRVDFLTPEQVKEDINALTEIVIDCYPSLDEITSKEAFKAYMDSTARFVGSKMDMTDFMLLMTRISAKIHDSHISFWPSWGVGKRSTWNLFLGMMGDSVQIVTTTENLTDYLGRKVKSIDGIDIDSVVKNLKQFVCDYDANAYGYINLRLLWGFNGLYANNVPGKKDGFSVTLDNGETIKIKRLYRRSKTTPSRDHLRKVNWHEGGFTTKMLNDSTAFIGLSTFSLDEVSVDSIRNFIYHHLDIPNMIVDVRNNGGGSDRVLYKILSYCTDRPYAALRHKSKVNRFGHFPSMKYCRNYTADSEIFDEGYKEKEGETGLYCDGGESVLMPDPEVAYGGRLYVLVDEMSCSAATLFPANIMRSHRGVVIGRETRTAYGFMTALKFADFTLPNSKVNWRIPLVKCIFDETDSPRIPWGRGVIPDVEVPFDDNYFLGKEDTILRRALQMIADGEYLGENPF